MNLKDETVGIAIPKRKEFYYLDSNIYYVLFSVEKIRTSLVQKGLITLTDENGNVLKKPNYTQMSWAEARDLGYKAVPVYFNKHQKRVVELKKELEVKDPWKD